MTNTTSIGPSKIHSRYALNIRQTENGFIVRTYKNDIDREYVFGNAPAVVTFVNEELLGLPDEPPIYNTSEGEGEGQNQPPGKGGPGEDPDT